MKHPAHPWQRDCLVVALETIELRGERLPLSYSQLTVEDRQITTALHYPVGWGRCRQGRAARPTGQELELAIATAHTLRPLSLEDLMEGDTPWNVFSLVEKVFRTAAQHDSLLVMHDPGRDLPVLVRAVAAWLDVDLPPVSVVSTAVLERACRLGLRQESGESPGDFYRRIATVEGELPGLLDCRSQKWADGLLRSADRLFAAMTTHLLYQHHFGGRLLQGGPGDGAVRLPGRSG
jgi:hypothetical protein